MLRLKDFGEAREKDYVLLLAHTSQPYLAGKVSLHKFILRGDTQSFESCFGLVCLGFLTHEE